MASAVCSLTLIIVEMSLVSVSSSMRGWRARLGHGHPYRLRLRACLRGFGMCTHAAKLAKEPQPARVRTLVRPELSRV